MIAPALLCNCAITWTCAAAIALGAPALPLHTLGAGLSLIAFAACWAFPSAARPVVRAPA